VLGWAEADQAVQVLAIIGLGFVLLSPVWTSTWAGCHDVFWP
jgi:hypothetical protein